jgi:hypothetical protein
MSTKHTPAPWTVFANREQEGTRYYVEHPVERTEHSSDFMQGVCDVDAFMCAARPDEAKATAALLAASPNLLAACEMAAAFVGMHTGNGVPAEYVGKYDPVLEDPALLLRGLTAVIAKAKGA